MAVTQDPTHYEGQDLEALGDLARYTGWILDTFDPWLRGRVIEVGAGIGNVSARYLDHVDQALLVEPALNLHAKLESRLGSHPKVRTSAALLHEVPVELTAEPFDAAIMVNVLEHIDDDRAVLADLHKLLRPGGAVLVFVPAHQWLYGSLDSLVHHVRRYEQRELQSKIADAGFEVALCRPFDLLGIAPWLVAGRVVKQKRFDERGAQLYDRFGVPLTRWLEKHVTPPYGKSLIAVGIRR